MVWTNHREGETYEMKSILTAITISLFLPSCWDGSEVREIGMQPALFHTESMESPGLIQGWADTIRERAMFGFGFANRGGRVYLPFWVGWDSSPSPSADEIELPFAYPNPPTILYDK